MRTEKTSKDKIKREQTTIRLPVDLKEGLQQEADRRGMEKLHLPTIHIENTGSLTKVFLNGEEVEGVVSIAFSHSVYEHKSFPTVKIELMADKVHLGTHQIFDLPAIYHPYYVSSDKLVGAGVLTEDQLNDLLEKGLL